MLEELHIRNFAIIEDIEVRFGPGLTVLTGETGAGKSILIGAIQLLLGAKAAPDQIREGAGEAVVEGVFDLSPYPEMAEVLESKGFDASDQVVFRRIVSRSGKSRAYINGQFSNIVMLADSGRKWVNIYGQHEHQNLLLPERHMDLLDEFGGTAALRAEWEERWKAYGALKAKIRELETNAEQIEAQRDLWEFQLSEIDGADLHPDEEDELNEERTFLLHAQRILDSLGTAEEALYGERGSALERVQTVERDLQGITDVDPQIEPIVETLSEASLSLEEAVRQIRDRLRIVDVDPQRLQIVEERLAEIQRLKRKYKGNVEEILTLASDLRQKLDSVALGKESFEEILREKDDRMNELLAAGKALSESRKAASVSLSGLVESELKDLGMGAPVFKVSLTRLETGEALGDGEVVAGPLGLEKAEFLLSSNKGESPRPLSRIASGGELSRIMLALKKALAEAEQVPTLIFDEIDSGIGGAVAHAVGEKLGLLASGHQVLCITHLAQIACFADSHLKVRKVDSEGRTTTTIRPLDPEDRIEEISRMLGGKVITETTREHARELLKVKTK